jgi:hypothetical protein
MFFSVLQNKSGVFFAADFVFYIIFSYEKGENN